MKLRRRGHWYQKIVAIQLVLAWLRSDGPCMGRLLRKATPETGRRAISIIRLTGTLG
jgi:hypothetical protein